MRSTIITLTFLSVFFVAPGLADDLPKPKFRTGTIAEPKAVPNGKVVVVATQEVPKPLVKRIADHLSGNLMIGVRQESAPVPKSGPLALLSKFEKSDGVAVILESRQGVSLADSLAVYTNLNICVVNVVALRPKAKTKLPSDEVLGRRTEKLVIQGVGRCIGMPFCLNPWCAMRGHVSMADLDEKGRNFCPVCLGKAMTALPANGIKLELPTVKIKGK